MELPIELEWQIIKFMKHPLTELFEETRWEYDWSDNWDSCNFHAGFFRRIRLRKLIREEEQTDPCFNHHLSTRVTNLYEEYYRHYPA